MSASKCLRKTIFFSYVLLIVLTVFLTPLSVHANSFDPQKNLEQSANMADLEDKDLAKTVGGLTGHLLSMIGVLFFILVVYGGILWMTSTGNSDQTSKAMKTIIAASVGLVLVMSSYIITNYVIGLVEDNSSSANSKNSCKNIAQNKGFTFGTCLDSCTGTWKEVPGVNPKKYCSSGQLCCGTTK